MGSGQGQATYHETGDEAERLVHEHVRAVVPDAVLVEALRLHLHERIAVHSLGGQLDGEGLVQHHTPGALTPGLERTREDGCHLQCGVEVQR